MSISDLTLTRSDQLQLLCQGGQEDCLQYLFHPPGFSGKRYHLYFELFREFVSSSKCCSDFTCPAEDEIGNVCFANWRANCSVVTSLSPLESPARGNALVAVEPQTRHVMISAGRIPKQNWTKFFKFFRTFQNRICQLEGCAKYKKCRWLQWRGEAVPWNEGLKADKLRMWSVIWLLRCMLCILTQESQ